MPHKFGINSPYHALWVHLTESIFQTRSSTVYLWVIDTRNASKSACCPVTIQPAPTATNLYDIPDTDTDFSYGTVIAVTAE